MGTDTTAAPAAATDAARAAAMREFFFDCETPICDAHQAAEILFDLWSFYIRPIVKNGNTVLNSNQVECICFLIADLASRLCRLERDYLAATEAQA